VLRAAAGTVVAHIHFCTHGIVFAGLCASCGADVAALPARTREAVARAQAAAAAAAQGGGAPVSSGSGSGGGGGAMSGKRARGEIAGVGGGGAHHGASHPGAPPVGGMTTIKVRNN
jgi:hypothetical protein